MKEGTETDKEISLQLVKDVAVTANVQCCYRLGKPSEGVVRSRPLVIGFASVEEKNEVQKSLRNLKGKSIWKGVSVWPYLTKIQYQESKKVFEDLCKEMKSKNEKHTGDGRWKIVTRDGVQKLVFFDYF